MFCFRRLFVSSIYREIISNKKEQRWLALQRKNICKQRKIFRYNGIKLQTIIDLFNADLLNYTHFSYSSTVVSMLFNHFILVTIIRSVTFNRYVHANQIYSYSYNDIFRIIISKTEAMNFKPLFHVISVDGSYRIRIDVTTFKMTVKW